MNTPFVCPRRGKTSVSDPTGPREEVLLGLKMSIVRKRTTTKKNTVSLPRTWTRKGPLASYGFLQDVHGIQTSEKVPSSNLSQPYFNSGGRRILRGSFIYLKKITSCYVCCILHVKVVKIQMSSHRDHRRVTIRWQ